MFGSSDKPDGREAASSEAIGRSAGVLGKPGELDC